MALADQIIGGEEMGSGSFSKEWRCYLRIVKDWAYRRYIERGS